MTDRRPPGSGLTLAVLPGAYTIIRADPAVPLPDWLAPAPGAVTAVLWSDREQSLMVRSDAVPPGTVPPVPAVDPWRCLRVVETFAPDQPGILASVVGPLAAAGVAVMAVASHDTDHLLVHDLDGAVAALRRAGHQVTP